MHECKIPVSYSKALVESAANKNLLDKVYEDMQFIEETCKMEEVHELLRSPIIPPSNKKKIIHELLEKKIHPLTLSLIDLMIKNGRESYLPSVSRIFRRETLKFQNITEPSLVTAVPLNDNIRKQISDFISGKFNTKVRLIENVDPGIIGGFVLKVNDYFIDASIKTRLRNIKKSLSGGIK
ncbi:MAG: ATP synthase F1 subunit delta [Bacteroidales bacterium]